jgi:hypothetical protein
MSKKVQDNYYLEPQSSQLEAFILELTHTCQELQEQGWDNLEFQHGDCDMWISGMRPPTREELQAQRGLELSQEKEREKGRKARYKLYLQLKKEFQTPKSK